MLEIIVRSEPQTLVRCAAAGKLLRRDILSPTFIRRVSRGVAPYILISMCTDSNKPFTLVHPATPTVTSFCVGHLFPFFSNRAAGLFGQYMIETSRRGLMLLRRKNYGRRTNSIMHQRNSDRWPDLCVYDPMSGAHTFLSLPPDEGSKTMLSCRKYNLLTAADGINYSFQLIVTDFGCGNMKVQTALPCGKWRRVMYVINDNILLGCVERLRDGVVLHGGIIHWLMYDGKGIISYNLRTQKVVSIKLPHTNCRVNQLHMATTSDGKLLKLLMIEGFKIYVWLHVPVSPASGSGWSLESVVDIEEKLRSLHPDIHANSPDKLTIFRCSWRSGDIVLLYVPRRPYDITVFDLETKDMHTQGLGYSMLEIDLPSHLQNMKIFS
jgi:hypothetical protein